MQAERDDPSQARRRVVVVVVSAAGDERPGQYQRGRREVGPRETRQSGEDVCEARVRTDERVAQRRCCHGQTSQRGADRRRLQQSGERLLRPTHSCLRLALVGAYNQTRRIWIVVGEDRVTERPERRREADQVKRRQRHEPRQERRVARAGEQGVEEE